MAARVFANSLFDPDYQIERRRTVSEFHRRLPGYHPTPLRAVTGLGDGRVFAKVESGRLGLPAFKILGASWAAVRAVEEQFAVELHTAETFVDLRKRVGRLGPITFVTATDGNHGRAIAFMARRLGATAHVLVPRGTTLARIAAIEGEGATVEVVDGDYDAAVRAAAALADDRTLVVSDTSWPGYEVIPHEVIDGYLTIFEEVTEQLGHFGIDGPDTVIVPTGVGALASAAARWYRADSIDHRARTELVTVEPTTAACVLASLQSTKITTVAGPHTSSMAGLNCGTPSSVAWTDIVPSVRWATTIDDDLAEAGMRILAGNGIVAGESGAAPAGLLCGHVRGSIAGDPSHVDALSNQLSTGVTLLLVTEGATDPEAYQRIVGHHPASIDRQRSTTADPGESFARYRTDGG